MSIRLISALLSEITSTETIKRLKTAADPDENKVPVAGTFMRNQQQRVIEDFSNKLYNEDFFRVVREIPDESVDLVIADGPYAVTAHPWDRIQSIQEYNLIVIRHVSRILKPGGVLYLFGKQHFLDFIDYRPYLKLNTRVIWYQPSRLAQGRKSYTNNYDVIAYFSKGDTACFNLDDIRVPQMVELTQRLRVENVPSVKNGKYRKTKFNPKGKNPGDVWGDIKQLTYRSKELMSREVLNTIQKPYRLLERLVLGSSSEGDTVFDAFAGTGTAMLAALKNRRVAFGCELNPDLVSLSIERFRAEGYSMVTPAKLEEIAGTAEAALPQKI